MGVSAPSLHRESIDSLIMQINVYCENPVTFSLPHNILTCMLVCYCSIALSIQITIKGAAGYFIVKHFSDQQTTASRNVMSLQCLAPKIGGVALIELWPTHIMGLTCVYMTGQMKQ